MKGAVGETRQANDAPGPVDCSGDAALSAASLANELALTRLLSLQQFHHFAFLVVSLAVLASAAGGELRALLPPRPSAQPLALGPSISRLGTFTMQIVVQLHSLASVACRKVCPFPLSLSAGVKHAPADSPRKTRLPALALLWAAGQVRSGAHHSSLDAPRRSRRRVPSGATRRRRSRGLLGGGAPKPGTGPPEAGSTRRRMEPRHSGAVGPLVSHRGLGPTHARLADPAARLSACQGRSPREARRTGHAVPGTGVGWVG